jgi:hypothetical protein
MQQQSRTQGLAGTNIESLGSVIGSRSIGQWGHYMANPIRQVFSDLGDSRLLNHETFKVDILLGSQTGKGRQQQRQSLAATMPDQNADFRRRWGTRSG